MQRVVRHGATAPIVLLGVVVLLGVTGGATSRALPVLLVVALLGAASGRRSLGIGTACSVGVVRIGLGLASGDLVAAIVDVAVWTAGAAVVLALAEGAHDAHGRLRRRDAEMTGFYDAHRDPSLLLDPHGVVRSVNRAVLELTGRDEAELVGRTLGHVIDPDLHARDVEHIRAARAGVPQLYDSRIRAADGAYRDIRVALHPLLDDGEVVGMSVVGHDVTSSLRGREALAASERRYRSIAEHAQVGIFEIGWADGEGRFTYVNPALEEMCGIPAQAWYDDVHVARHHVPEEDQHALGIDAGQRTGLLDGPARYRWRRPDGVVRWHEVAEVPIRDSNGRLHSIQGIIHDVTDVVDERDVLAEALARKERAVHDLERLDAMKTTFLQSVSHELRTPLTGIVGMSSTLRERGEDLDDATIRSVVDALHRNAEKLSALLVDLLDVDRLSRGVLAPKLTRVDLRELVANVTRDLDLEGRRLQTELVSAPLLGDGPKLERIIENLLVNAVRHTPAEAIVQVSTGVDGEIARLVVEDDGFGVPTELRSEVFRPFVQGPRSHDDARPGTGIGLSLVASLTELHGGTVRVEEVDGGGARFIVELPTDGQLPVALDAQDAATSER